MTNKQHTIRLLNSQKTFFPSIPSPRATKHNMSLILQKNISQTLSPRSLNKDALQIAQSATKEQKVVSNFLLRYLSRKQTQQMKWNAANYAKEMLASKCDKKIDPRFRRVYLKKIKGQKKNLVSRFLIGNQESFHEPQVKSSQTLQK